jgi:Predicted membrane protein
MHEKTLRIINDEIRKPVETASPLVNHPVELEPFSMTPEAPASVVSSEPAASSEPMAEEDLEAPKALYPSRYVGKALPLFFLNIGCFFLATITLGIMFPWCLCWTARYEAANTCIDGRPIVFDGRGSELIGKWLLYLFLLIITCGIFGLWIPKKILNWKLAHVHLAD